MTPETLDPNVWNFNQSKTSDFTEPEESKSALGYFYKWQIIDNSQKMVPLKLDTMFKMCVHRQSFQSLPLSHLYF